MSPDTLSVAVRAASFVLLFQAAGAAIFLAIFRLELPVSARAVSGLAWRAAFAGLVFAALHLALDAARMTGDFSGLWDPLMHRMVWTSWDGLSQILQIIGLLIIGCSLALDIHHWRIALAGVVLAIAAFALTGHTSSHPWRVVLAPLLEIHLWIIAFWFGSLLPMWRVSRLESAQVAARVIRRFSALATGLVPVIVFAGVAMTVLIAHGLPSVRKPYGALILTKLCIFALLMVFAASNKWNFLIAIEAGHLGAMGKLRRSLVAEWLLIIGALAVTATMTGLFSPDD